MLKIIREKREIHLMGIDIEDDFYIYKVGSYINQRQKDYGIYAMKGIIYWWRIEDGDVFCSDGSEKVSQKFFNERYKK